MKHCELLLSSDEEAVQIFRIFYLQKKQLLSQSQHCWLLQSLKPLLQKLPSFCYVSIAVISHTVMYHQYNVFFIHSQDQMVQHIVSLNFVSAISLSNALNHLVFPLLLIDCPVSSSACSMACPFVPSSAS